MDLYLVLQKLNIAYQEVEHPPVVTVAAAQAILQRINGTGCKNLLLTDERKTRYLLVILEGSRRADLKAIAQLAKMSRLSFASDADLHHLLGLTKGSVSPFGLLNDTCHRICVIIDKTLAGKTLLFHPNINTKTLAVSWSDLLRFIEFTHHSCLFL